MKRMSYFLLGFTIVAALLLSIGCAGKNFVSRTQFMERAIPFDQKYMSYPKYRDCLGQFNDCLLANCMEAAEKASDEYWQCAWDCLDEAEECMSEGRESR